MLLLAILAVVGSAAIACAPANAGDADERSEGEGGSDDETPAQQAEFAAALADAYCVRVFACGPVTSSLLFGGVDACRELQAQHIFARFGLEGSGATSAGRAACEPIVAAAPCQDLLQDRWLQLCEPEAGTVADGEPCADDAQCASGFCSYGDRRSGEQPQFCGYCRARAAAGDPCSSAADCPHPLGCLTSTFTCGDAGSSRLPEIGAACAADNGVAGCGFDAVCDATTERCVAGPSEGQSCIDGACGSHLLTCDVDSGANLCVIDPFVCEGGCGFTVPDLTLCSQR
jgi:hypothetical protein